MGKQTKVVSQSSWLIIGIHIKLQSINCDENLNQASSYLKRKISWGQLSYSGSLLPVVISIWWKSEWKGIWDSDRPCGSKKILCPTMREYTLCDITCNNRKQCHVRKERNVTVVQKGRNDIQLGAGGRIFLVE